MDPKRVNLLKFFGLIGGVVAGVATIISGNTDIGIGIICSSLSSAGILKAGA